MVKNFTVNDKCSNCGQCCSNLLPMSEKEVKNIKAYIKAHNIKEQRHNAMQGVDMTCPFRDEKNKKCLIYAVRPQICRRFMCNATMEKINADKMYLHGINRVVFMRSEFFNNTEDYLYVNALARGGYLHERKILVGDDCK